MTTKLKIVSSAAALIAIGGGALFYYHKPNTQPVACTLEAKICPDGSAVGRSGPACEFAACPETASTASEIATSTTKGQGTLKGQMTIGPVCPVETINNPCKPTPEMYAAAKVFVYKMDKKTLVKTITPDANGRFSVSLPTGEYFIDMIHQRIGGTIGVPTTITIVSGKSVTLNLNVDTGLR